MSLKVRIVSGTVARRLTTTLGQFHAITFCMDRPSSKHQSTVCPWFGCPDTHQGQANYKSAADEYGVDSSLDNMARQDVQERGGAVGRECVVKVLDSTSGCQWLIFFEHAALTLTHLCHSDGKMVYLTGMSIPTALGIPSMPSDYSFRQTPSRSGSVGPSHGPQDHGTSSPFRSSGNYAQDFQSSRGGTPFDLSADSTSMYSYAGPPSGYASTTSFGRSGPLQRFLPNMPTPRMTNTPESSQIPTGSSGTELLALQTEIKVLHVALKGILSAIPDVLAMSNAQLPDNFTVPDPAPNAKRLYPSSNTVANGPLRVRDPLPAIHRTDVPLVTIWTTQDWADTPKDDDATDPNQVKKKKGKTNAYLGHNMTMKYVQDQQGKVIDGYYASAIRDAAYQIWYELLLRGIAPPKWSQVSLGASDFYYQEMEYRFPELRFCGGPPAHWKSRHIARDNFPAFVQGLSRKNMTHLLRPLPYGAIGPSITAEGDPSQEQESEAEMVLISDLPTPLHGKRYPPKNAVSSTTTPNAAKRQRRLPAPDTTTAPTITTIIQDPLANLFLPTSPSQTLVTPHTDVAAGSNMGTPVLSHENIPVPANPLPHNEHLMGIPLTQILEPAVNQSTRKSVPAESLPRHAMAPTTNEQEITERTVALDHAGVPNNTHNAASDGLSTNIIAARSTHTEMSAIARAHTTAPTTDTSLNLTACPLPATMIPGPATAILQPGEESGTTGPAPPTTPPAGTPATSDRLWPLRTVTGRNICGFRWKEKTPNASKQEFDLYWKMLPKPEKKVYNDEAKGLKATRIA
ncbi:hypothetical protein HETIRDRAFT_429724 [Heterobasidion irregulare TC 32-1]|uniref:Uncharacterized protein n=1 Tax=Heterobasidion irregulare (strain TC 32-1) TaxID=747525 RepID=W4JVD5_HETIT|nr:uncharacterized protein HETIRDRAFT_429724 [Heterobasidion irregulare TC 32-1]ETW77538.1 hypothetical protein HETIRDRAFT_429724 [Heterobasidion irregulare TC 32-1]